MIFKKYKKKFAEFKNEQEEIEFFTQLNIEILELNQDEIFADE